MKDLLLGMMVVSGNDAANVIAKAVGGTIPHFMEGMNAYLKKLGCKDTIFYNPHGLHYPKHVTTAYDMALMTCIALKDPTFREIVSTARCSRPKTNRQEASQLVQSNRLLRKGKFYYPKATGVKTGHTSFAQYTLVASATDGERTLVAVLLRTKEREDTLNDAIKLFEEAFNQQKVQRIVLSAGRQNYSLEQHGAAKPIKTYTKENAVIEFYPAEEVEVKGLSFWKSLTFPVQKDQCVGEIQIQTAEGKILNTVSLFAQESIESTWSYWFKSFFNRIGV